MNLSQEEQDKYITMYDLYGTGEKYPMIDQTIVEKTAKERFGVGVEALRKEDCYWPSYQAYELGWLGIGEPYVNVITDATVEEDKIVLTVSYLDSVHFDRDISAEPLGEYEQRYELHIHLKKDGLPQYGPSIRL